MEQEASPIRQTAHALRGLLMRPRTLLILAAFIASDCGLGATVQQADAPAHHYSEGTYGHGTMSGTVTFDGDECASSVSGGQINASNGTDYPSNDVWYLQNCDHY